MVLKANVGPRWYTPERLLALLCVVSFLVYLDRGIISSNGVNGTPRKGDEPGAGIQGDFDLTYFETGVLPAAFMLGLMIASPVFAYAAELVGGFRLIGVGMAVWLIASVACGMAQGFLSLLIARIFMGVGEASFCSLSDPFVAQVAPPAKRTMWFAVLYLSGNVGYPVGYVVGGLLGTVPPLFWRTPFFVQAAAVLPVVLFMLVAPPVQLELAAASKGNGAPQCGDEDTGGQGGAACEGDGIRGVWRLFTFPLWVINALGNAAMNFGLGAYSYWGPKVVVELYGTRPDVVDTTLGVVVILCSIVATLLGGWYLDASGFTMTSAMAINAVSLLLSYLLLQLAITFAATFSAYTAIFLFGMLALFFPMAPAAAIGMYSVPSWLRPMASACGTIALHLLGDVPSPVIVGALQEWLMNWPMVISILNLSMLAGTGLYFLGVLQAPRSTCFLDDEGLSEWQANGDGSCDEGHQEHTALLNRCELPRVAVADDDGGAGGSLANWAMIERDGGEEDGLLVLVEDDKK